MTTHLIHGFNVNDGGFKTISKLKPYLVGDVVTQNYGWTGLLGLHWANKRAVKQIMAKIKPGDSLVLHSNAALIGWQIAQEMSECLDAIVCINPALRRDAEWPKDVPVLCLYNSKDWVVQLGRIWGRLFPYDGVELQGWGAAGRYGFTNKKFHGTNWDTSEQRWKIPVEGHSAIFHDSAVSYWGGLINRWLQTAWLADIDRRQPVPRSSIIEPELKS